MTQMSESGIETGKQRFLNFCIYHNKQLGGDMQPLNKSVKCFQSKQKNSKEGMVKFFIIETGKRYR
jgi:hypothetical protein